MKIYQGESLTFILDQNADGDDLSQYIIRAVLVAAHDNCDCTCILTEQDAPARNPVAVSWNDIPVADGAAMWHLTSEQSRALNPGIYFMEIAFRDKERGHEIKRQTMPIINVKPSFTIPENGLQFTCHKR